MRIFLIAFSLCLLIGQGAFAQCTAGFQATYSGMTRGQGIYGTADSGAVVVGYSGGDARVIKLNDSGAVDWSRDFQSTINNAQYYWTDVVQHANGKYYVTGIDTSWLVDRALLMELNASGQPQWSRGIGTVADSFKVQLLGDLIIADNGTLVAAGRFSEFPGILRFDVSGNLIKSTINRGPFGTVAITRMQVIQLQDGGFAMRFNQGNQVFICRYDANLDLQWTRFLIGNRQGDGIAETPGGSLIISGTGSPGFWATAISANGTFIWGKEFTHPGNPKGGAVLTTFDDNLMFSGNINGFGSGSGRAAFLMKTDTLGNIIWTKAYNEAGGNEVYRLNRANNAGFWLTGNQGILTNPLGLVVIKTDFQGKTGNGCEFPVTGMTASSALVFNNIAQDSTDNTIGIFVHNYPFALASATQTLTCAPDSVGALPSVNLGADTALCAGDSTLLDAQIASPNSTYLWNTGDTTANITVSTAGYYSVIVENNAGCATFEDIFVDVYAAPILTLPADTQICDLDTVTISASTIGATYGWNTGDTTQSITLGTAGTYWVDIVDSNGCFAADTFLLQVDSLPTVNIGPDDTICPTLLFPISTNNPGASFLWSTGSVNSSIIVTAPDTYWVDVTLPSGCSSRDSLVLSNFTPLTASFPSDTNLCQGDTILLDAGNPGANYQWLSGDTTQTILVSDTGTYEVDITDTNGCITSEAIDVFVNPLPIPSLGNDTVFCVGGQFLLDAGWPGNSFLWQDSSMTQTYLVDTVGMYFVQVTDSIGCTGADTINLNETPLPIVNIGPDTLVCPDNSYTFDAGNPGSMYMWSDSSTGQTLQPGTPGTFSVTVTDVFGCMGADTAALGFLPGPFVDLGADTAVCAGVSITLDAGNPGASYQWTGGATTQTLTATTSGTYAVFISDTSNCTATDTVDLIFEALPVVDLGPDTSICQSAVVNLDAGNPGNNYFWSNGSVGQTLQAGQPGTYSVTVTSAIGCTGQDSVVIIRDTAVTAIFSYLGGPSTLDFFDLSVGTPTSWLWDFGDGTTSTLQNPIHTFGSGTFNVCMTAIDACGSDISCQTIVVLSQHEPGSIEMSLQPNPADNQVRINLTGLSAQSVPIEIISPHGQIIQKLRLEPGQTSVTLEISHYAQGIYWLRGEIDGQIIVKKLIISH